jgi:hypothetical protein
MNCDGCTHESGRWGDAWCSHTDYCQKCVRNYRNLVDNYHSNSTDERTLYENLRRKYEGR